MSQCEQEHGQGQEHEQPVNIIPEVVDRFEPDDPALKDFLTKNGFVVVKGVMNQTNIDIAKEKLWEFLDNKAGMKKHDKNTWTTSNLENVGLPSNGILCLGIGQTDFMWYMRLLPKVKTAFSLIHDTDDLLSSMDGGNIFLPWHRDESTHHMKTETGWYHVDQGCQRRGFQCVQGLVSLTDVTAATGGLCLIPGSSTCHEELVELTGEESNFVEVPPTFHVLTQKQILPLCEAGDMILWDSRTVHCSTPALEAPTTSPDELLRIAAYICMTPKKWATNDVLQNRVQAYMRDMSLHHWPHIITHQIDPSDPIVFQYQDASEEMKHLIA
jgi:ectoine hydroxylase-related dioxygenase (phytanoyl-CoA dioxygenase family)